MHAHVKNTPYTQPPDGFGLSMLNPTKVTSEDTVEPNMLGHQTIALILIVTIPFLTAGVWMLKGKKSHLKKAVGGAAIFLFLGSILLTAYYFYWLLFIST